MTARAEAAEAEVARLEKLICDWDADPPGSTGAIAAHARRIREREGKP